MLRTPFRPANACQEIPLELRHKNPKIPLMYLPSELGLNHAALSGSRVELAALVVVGCGRNV